MGTEDREKSAERTVVVIGASIPGMVCASRLARSSEFGGRVVLLTGPPPVAKRLINGCSLRWGTVQCMADALGTDPEELWEALGGAPASFSQMWVGWSRPRDSGYAWIRQMRGGMPDWIGLSTRHGHILSCLRARLPEGVEVVEASVPLDAALEGPVLRLAEGDVLTLPRDHLLVNATPHFGLLRGKVGPPAPRRFVLAVQQAQRAVGDLPFGRDVGLVPTYVGETCRQLGFHTPFADPDTPEADWYGINTAVVKAADLDRDAMMADLEHGLKEMTRALGMEPVAHDDTVGRAIIPVVDHTGVQTQEHLGFDLPLVDLHRTVSPGAPAVNTDGMLAGTVGADAFARALVASSTDLRSSIRPALVASDRALRPIRFWNRTNIRTYLENPGWLAGLLAWLSQPAMPYLVKLWTRLGVD